MVVVVVRVRRVKVALSGRPIVVVVGEAHGVAPVAAARREAVLAVVVLAVVHVPVAVGAHGVGDLREPSERENAERCTNSSVVSGCCFCICLLLTCCFLLCTSCWLLLLVAFCLLISTCCFLLVAFYLLLPAFCLYLLLSA